MEQVFGRYRLVPRLSQGGFGNVHLAEDMNSGTPVCIKVWKAKTEKEEEEFLAEAQMLNRLFHPNIIRVLDSGKVDDIAFFVTTYAPYGNLQYHYREGISYPLTTILLHIKQIASTLQYIHDQGFVHCGVHPSHFLLGEHHEILLCGFSLARELPSPGASAKQTSGIPGYTAPEHFRGEVSPASDQYALAVVVYEWLCGERPFKGSRNELFYLQFSLPPPLRSKIPTLSPRVEQIVLRALSTDPQQRFPSVQDFANALEAASIVPGQIEIFFSYSHKDAILRDELAKRLAHLKQQGLLIEWHDREIEAGRDWAYEVDTHLRTAHIILLLISPDFLASDYCYHVEMTKALKRHENGEAIVIPIILRPAPWMDTPLSKLQALPQGGKPITRWSNQDEAFLEVAHGIQRVIQRLTAS